MTNRVKITMFRDTERELKAEEDYLMNRYKGDNPLIVARYRDEGGKYCFDLEIDKPVMPHGEPVRTDDPNITYYNQGSDLIDEAEALSDLAPLLVVNVTEDHNDGFKHFDILSPAEPHPAVCLDESGPKVGFYAPDYKRALLTAINWAVKQGSPDIGYSGVVEVDGNSMWLWHFIKPESEITGPAVH